MRKRWNETMQKRSGGFRTHSRFDPLIGVCVGCRDTGARGAFQRCMLRCAIRADAGSFLRPTASGKDTSRRLRAPQTPRPRSPCHPARRVRRCAHTSHGAAPGPQQPANNPTLLPLPVSPGHVARTPRSAGQQPSAADAGVGGQNLFSSQAGRGTRPAGEASSSGTALQGRSEADIGTDVARQRGQAKLGGKDVRCSLREVAAARLRIAGLHTEGVHLTSWRRPPRG